jgi:transcriptional regulator with XRE-family HTH domain
MQLTRTKQWREARGLTQRGLAAEAGISEVTVARLETGHASTPSTARKVADALGVSPADLMENPPAPLVEALRPGRSESGPAKPPTVHFAKLSDASYEEVRSNAHTIEEKTSLREHLDAEQAGLEHWLSMLGEQPDAASAADIEEARSLLANVRKRRAVAIFDEAEHTVAFDEERSPRASRTAGKSVDEAYAALREVRERENV